MAELQAKTGPGLRLNLGCGYKRQEGWIGVDSADAVKPDILWDLEKTPWPFSTETVDEIAMIHSLEHMGRETETFTAICQEAYRILKVGGLWLVVFPDVYNDNFWGDPTHCRPITVGMLGLLSQEQNKKFIANNWANSAYGIHIGVNFKTTDIKCLFTSDWSDLDPLEALEARKKYINVVDEWRVLMQKEPLLADSE